MPSILLVADAEWVRNDVEAALTEPGTTLTVERDPRAAARLVASERFDWALVDMQVGSMGGMAIVRMLRTAIASGSTDDMSIILLLDRSADEFIAGRAGADAALLKPFTAQELRARMAAVVD
jgi:DNA-binding response OmpR family regulator